MIKSALLVPLLLKGVAAAFMPPMHLSIQRHQSAVTNMNHMFPEASSLEVVDGEASEDPFDSYKATDEQKIIGIKVSSDIVSFI